MIDGNVMAINPGEESRMQMFIWNNIFFSLGFDVRDHYKELGGDAAAYIAPKNDLQVLAARFIIIFSASLLDRVMLFSRPVGRESLQHGRPGGIIYPRDSGYRLPRLPSDCSVDHTRHFGA